MQKNVSNKLCKQRIKARNKKDGNKDVSKWEWNKRYSKGVRNKSRYSDDSFKKTKNRLTNINPKYVNTKEPIKIRLEMDEMWGRVYCKQTPCWLWHAINHETGEIVAFVLGTRKHDMLRKLYTLFCAI